METPIPADRSRLVGSIVEAYMELFVRMQSTAVSHWLMNELTYSQARALILLAAHKSLTVSGLAKQLSVGTPTASLLVQQLVERGLVVRAEDPGDRRRAIIRLSERGEEIGEDRKKRREEQWQRWLSNLTDDELDALAKGLGAILGVVKKESGQGN